MVKRKRNYAARIRKAAQKAEDERAASVNGGINDAGETGTTQYPLGNDNRDEDAFTGDEGEGSISDEDLEHDGAMGEDLIDDQEGDDEADEDEEDADNDEDEEDEGEEEDGEEEDEEEDEDLDLVSRGSSDESDYGDDDDLEGDDEEEDRHIRSQGAGPSRAPAKFLEGEKGESFAKAFSKILQHKTKQQKPSSETTNAPVGGEEGPILAESKSVAKRKAEELEAAKASRAAKKLRLDMRRRGHVRATRKGEDTAADLKEKQLNRLATRGVVLLFNAVASAQKQRQEASTGGVGGSKVARLNKASFLSQLKGSAAAAEGAAAGNTAAAGSVLGLGRRAKAAQSAPGDGSAAVPGWKVLQEGFTGLPGSSKMKDWDKAQSESDDPDRIEVGSEEEGDDGW